MRGVLAELNEREYSINRLLAHVDELSELRGKVELIVVLKSSTFIALYNNIEATVYATIENIHDSLSSMVYDDLIDPLRIKLLRYSFGKAAVGLMKDPLNISAEEDKLRANAQTFPQVVDYVRRQSLFSGNLDARQINVLSKSYGAPRISFPKEDALRMLWVKNKRNKIAHGEQAMSTAGQGIKNHDLRETHHAIGRILRLYISGMNAYLDGNVFRRPC
jgi:hypothetical protein